MSSAFFLLSLWVKNCSVQFSPLTNWVVRGKWGTLQQRSFSSLFCWRPLSAVLAWAGMSTLWCFPSCISSASYGIADPPRCSKWRMFFQRLLYRVTFPPKCKFSSPDSCQKRFLWTHKEVDLVLHPVVGLEVKEHSCAKLTCCQERKCTAHGLQVRQKCGDAHVSGMFFSPVQLQSIWPLQWAGVHWKETMSGQKWQSKEWCVLSTHADWLTMACHSNLNNILIVFLIFNLKKKKLFLF